MLVSGGKVIAIDNIKTNSATLSGDGIWSELGLNTSAVIDPINNNISSLSSDVNTISGNLNVVSGEVTTLKTDVSTISSNLNAVSSEVTTLKTDINTISGNLNVVSSDVSTISSDLANVSSKLLETSGKIDTEIQERKDDVSALSGAISAEIEARKEADNAISAALDSEIEKRQNQVNELSAAIDENSDNIFIVSSYADSISAGLDEETEARLYDIDVLEGKVEALSSYLDEETLERYEADEYLSAAIDTKQRQLSAGTDLKIENNVVSVNTNGSARGENSFVEGKNTFASDLCDHVEGMGGIADQGGCNHIEGFQYSSYNGTGPASQFYNTNKCKLYNSPSVSTNGQSISVSLYEFVKAFKDKFLISCNYSTSTECHSIFSTFYKPKLYKIIDVNLIDGEQYFEITIDGIFDCQSDGSITLWGPVYFTSITGGGGSIRPGETKTTFTVNGLGFSGNSLENVRTDNCLLSVSYGYTPAGESSSLSFTKLIKLTNISYDSSTNVYTFETDDGIEIPSDATNPGFGFTVYLLNAYSYGCNHIEGINNILVSCSYAHIEGRENKGFGNQAHAEGQNTTAQGENSHSEGNWTNSQGSCSHAEGYSTYAQGQYSHSEGNQTKATGGNSHAEGDGTSATNGNTHAEGWHSIAAGNCSHAECRQTSAYGSYSHTEGNSTLTEGEASHAEGHYTKARGNYTHAEGYETSAYGFYSHTEGNSTLTEGEASHAEGNYTSAIGSTSHTEGNKTSAAGKNTHAEGLETSAQASFYAAHAEGYKTLSTGDYGSHAEGNQTSAIAYATHAEGNSTLANYSQAHAEGYKTSASNENAHAEGRETLAKGMHSHAEGYCTSAIKQCSHAEGSRTSAAGEFSHAEGYYTSAIGNYSHAAGYYTKANNSAMTVIGKYNKTTLGSFVIGNGTSTTQSDAFIVDWDGVASAVNLKTSAGQVIATNSTPTDGQVLTYDGTNNSAVWAQAPTPETVDLSAGSGIVFREEQQTNTTYIDVDAANYKLLTTAEYNTLTAKVQELETLLTTYSGLWVLTNTPQNNG